MKFRVRPMTMNLKPGEVRTRKVKLRKHRKSVAKLRRLLKKRSYRLGSRATLRVTATDAAANRTEKRIQVRLRP